jgi:hypothetical protein
VFVFFIFFLNSRGVEGDKIVWRLFLSLSTVMWLIGILHIRKQISYLFIPQLNSRQNNGVLACLVHILQCTHVPLGKLVLLLATSVML